MLFAYPLTAPTHPNTQTNSFLSPSIIFHFTAVVIQSQYKLSVADPRGVVIKPFCFMFPAMEFPKEIAFAGMN